MSGSEFERGTIVTETLTANSATEPVKHEPAREHTWRPPAEGLYDLSQEKDSCGVSFIANMKGVKSHQIVSDALSILCNLEHRGAVGADPRAGDGAGILVQIPHTFFSRKAKELGFQLPKPGQYAVGALFMPREDAWRGVIQGIIGDQIKAEGLTLLGWRTVPTDNSSLGVPSSQPNLPTCRCSSDAAIKPPTTISSARSTSCASRSRRRFSSAASAAFPVIIRRRCRAAP